MNRVAILLLALALSACATTKDSVLLGAGLGAGTGAAVGASHNDGKGALLGGAIGAASGALIGYIINKANKKSGPPDSLSKKEPSEDTVPSLTQPQVRRVWIGDKVEDDKLVKGHFIYVIEKNSQWSTE